MKKEETEFIELEVKTSIIPDIKAEIPTILAWVLRAIFPKLELKIINAIQRIVMIILSNRGLK